MWNASSRWNTGKQRGNNTYAKVKAMTCEMGQAWLPFVPAQHLPDNFMCMLQSMETAHLCNAHTAQ